MEDNADDDALSEDEAPKGAEELIAPEGLDEPVPEDIDETTVTDEPEDEHTDEPVDIEEALVVEEETDVDDEGQDILLTTKAEEPENDD